jgi:hypothetical protein
VEYVIQYSRLRFLPLRETQVAGRGVLTLEKHHSIRGIYCTGSNSATIAIILTTVGFNYGPREFASACFVLHGTRVQRRPLRYIETRQISREHPMNASRTFAYGPRRHAQEYLLIFFETFNIFRKRLSLS